LPLTGLMYKPQLILPIEKTSKRIHNCAVDRLRALASPKDEDGIRSHMRLRRNGFEFRANRIAGDDPTVAEIRLRARIGDGSKVDPFAERTVGESGNPTLFNALRRCYKQYGSGEITPIQCSRHGKATKQMPAGPAARYDHSHESQIRTKLTRLLRHI